MFELWLVFLPVYLNIKLHHPNTTYINYESKAKKSLVLKIKDLLSLVKLRY